MSAGTSEFFCLICFLMSTCTALEIIRPEKITAELGKNVTLPCKAHNNNNIKNIVVEWSRPDQDPKYVFLYRNSKCISVNQHPCYQNRVNLQDKEMKDGDVSLILKNVKMEDNGTYECYTFLRETSRKKRSNLNEPIRIINLVVRPSGDKDAIIGNGGDKTGGDKTGGDIDGISREHLGVVGVILLLAVFGSVGFLIYRRSMVQNPNLPVPPDETAAIEMLTVPEQHQNQPQNPKT